MGGATASPPPLAGEGQGGGMQYGSSFPLAPPQPSPSPTLPRKRGREHTERAACPDSISQNSAPLSGAVRGVSPVVAKHDERAVVVAAPLELIEAGGRGERRARRLLDHGERTGDEPPAGVRRGERSLREPLPIGWIQEGERERRQRMDAAELDRVAAENARDTAQAERLDVFPHERARLGGSVHEQREDRTA